MTFLSGIDPVSTQMPAEHLAKARRPTNPITPTPTPTRPLSHIYTVFSAFRHTEYPVQSIVLYYIY
jgi:hypothetical protein